MLDDFNNLKQVRINRVAIIMSDCKSVAYLGRDKVIAVDGSDVKNTQ